MAKKKYKKNRAKRGRPIPKTTQTPRNTYHLPLWSTTLGCVGGAVGCFHPVCGVVMMVGVWLLAFWESNM